jgi:hypothetical protein
MLAVFWIVCRRDQVWGLNRNYYLARHGVRLLIFALLANGAAQNAFATANNLPAMEPLTAIFKTPVQWLPVLLMLAFWQIFFMRAHHFRIYWNKKLQSWFLRPKGFAPFYFSWKKSQRSVLPQTPIPMPGQYGRLTNDDE